MAPIAKHERNTRPEVIYLVAEFRVIHLNAKYLSTARSGVLVLGRAQRKNWSCAHGQVRAGRYTVPSVVIFMSAVIYTQILINQYLHDQNVNFAVLPSFKPSLITTTFYLG